MPHPRLLLAALLVAISAHAVTVRLTDSDSARVQVALHPGDVLRVDLAAEPVTGRTWSVQGRAPSQLTELGAAQRVFGGRMSDQGTSSFAWLAMGRGEGELTLVYGTATSRAEKPEKAYTVQISVSGDPLGPEEAHPAPVSQMEQVAAYERSESCGDCTALTETLMLYRAPDETPYLQRRFGELGRDETPFVLRRVYTNAPGGTLTSVMTGSWSTSKGTADPTATVYTLIASSETSLFRLDGDRLIPLDAQQIPVPAAIAFHRVVEP